MGLLARFRVALATWIWIWTCTVVSMSLAAEPHFTRQVLDGEIQIGYGLALGRVDADDHTDVLLADKQEIVWYQNPGRPGEAWPKHVIARNLTQRDNVCLAARDIDGDGLVEIAIGADWNPGETSDAQISGTLFYLQRPSDPRAPWKPVRITPHDPTTHRMHWIKAEDGFRLVVLPLHGVDNEAGSGREVEISVFEVSDGVPRLVNKIDTSLHMTHNFDLLVDDEVGAGQHEFMLVAGKEGYVAITTEGEVIPLVGPPESRGAGEVRRCPTQVRVFAGIEPMHGTDVAIYREVAGDTWDKEVLDTNLGQGHALAAGDLVGDGGFEIVAGWRGRDPAGKVGIKLYVSEGNDWQTYWVDDNQIACEDLKVVDLDGDGKLDIIAAGRATKNVVIYWNHTQ